MFYNEAEEKERARTQFFQSNPHHSNAQFELAYSSMRALNGELNKQTGFMEEQTPIQKEVNELLENFEDENKRKTNAKE